MAVCDLTGKGKQHGNNVSFSLRRTKRTFKPNIQKKTVLVDGKKVKLNLSTQAIRTLKESFNLKLIKMPKTLVSGIFIYYI